MGLRFVTALAVVAGLNTYAAESFPITEMISNAEVIAAMNTAWKQTANGTRQIEAGFRCDATRLRLCCGSVTRHEPTYEANDQHYSGRDNCSISCASD